MSRRIKASDILNCPTYPGEYIYVPDMLVAIVALSEYSKYYNGKYSAIVNQWIHKAQTEWLDKNTGLSFIVIFITVTTVTIMQKYK